MIYMALEWCRRCDMLTLQHYCLCCLRVGERTAAGGRGRGASSGGAAGPSSVNLHTTAHYNLQLPHSRAARRSGYVRETAIAIGPCMEVPLPYICAAFRSARGQTDNAQLRQKGHVHRAQPRLGTRTRLVASCRLLYRMAFTACARIQHWQAPKALRVAPAVATPGSPSRSAPVLAGIIPPPDSVAAQHD